MSDSESPEQLDQREADAPLDGYVFPVTLHDCDGFRVVSFRQIGGFGFPVHPRRRDEIPAVGWYVVFTHQAPPQIIVECQVHPFVQSPTAFPGIAADDGGRLRNKAEVGKQYARKNPSELQESINERKEKLRKELKRALEEGYSLDYEKLIEEYFRNLNNNLETN